MGCCLGEPLGVVCPCPGLPRMGCCLGEECLGLSLGWPASMLQERQEPQAQEQQEQQEPPVLPPEVLQAQALLEPLAPLPQEQLVLEPQVLLAPELPLQVRP